MMSTVKKERKPTKPDNKANECNKSSKTKWKLQAFGLRRYLKTHKCSRQCKISDKDSKSRTSAQHVQKVHKQKVKFQCPVCSKGYHHKVAFDNHCKAHPLDEVESAIAEVDGAISKKKRMRRRLKKLGAKGKKKERKRKLKDLDQESNESPPSPKPKKSV